MVLISEITLYDTLKDLLAIIFKLEKTYSINLIIIYNFCFDEGLYVFKWGFFNPLRCFLLDIFKLTFKIRSLYLYYIAIYEIIFISVFEINADCILLRGVYERFLLTRTLKKSIHKLNVSLGLLQCICG